MEVVEGAGEEELGQVALHSMTKMTVMIMKSTILVKNASTSGGGLTTYGSGGGSGRGGGGGGLVGEGAEADAVLALGETVPGLAGEDYPILAEVQCLEL